MMAARREGPTATEIAAELARRAQALCAELLPRGHREGHEWVCGSLAGEEGRSLGVELSGERAGVWVDRNGYVDKGDALDLVARCRYGGDIGSAIAWSLSWLGWSDRSAPAPSRPAPPPRDDANAAAMAEKKRRRAQAIWLQAQPSLAGTPVAAYLAGRGIDLAELGRQPRALRYHPAVRCEQVNADLPAMVAAANDLQGRHVSTHRTWLARDGERWKKARLERPKMLLGSIDDGFIPLWRGASQKPMREAPQGDHVVIAEGIETALSVALACPELRVISAVSLGRMGAVALPPAIATVTLAFDNDPPPPDGTPPDDRRWDDYRKQRAAREQAIARYAGEGRVVNIAMPAVPGADWNDILQGVEG